MSSSLKLPIDWQTAERVIDAGARRILLYGPPGTGKTFAGRHKGIGKRRVFNIYVGEETPAYDVIGHDVVVDGSMHFRYGPGPNAWLAGGRLVINELDKASGDTLDALLAICDDPESAGYILPNGEYIEPAAGFQVVATMNGDPSELPEAMASRFAIRVKIEHPHPAALAKLPENIRKTAEHMTGPRMDDRRRMNVRQFHSYAELLTLGVDEETAALATFHDQATAILDATRVDKVKAAV